MKTIRIFAFSLLISLAFTSVLLAKEKDENDDSESDNGVTIEKLTLVRDAGDKFVPVQRFRPTDIFGVLVKLSGSNSGTKVKGVWTIVDAGGMKDKKILDRAIEMTDEKIKESKNPSRIDFTLSHDNPYPPGDYKFEVYLNGELADTVEFTIEE